MIRPTIYLSKQFKSNYYLFGQRIRELRLRAVNGASSGQLIRQMMFELACATFLTLLFAWLFVALISPVFFGLLNIVAEMPKLNYLFAVCGAVVMLLILLFGLIHFWRLSRLAISPASENVIVGKPVLQRVAVMGLDEPIGTVVRLPSFILPLSKNTKSPVW